MTLRRLSLITTLLLSGTAYAEIPVATVTGIPSVPAAAAKANLEPRPTPGLDRRVLMMKPGVNEIVQVAQIHLNRIVTPFERPSVKTVSNATVETTDNVIYVSTPEESPVTLFVTETGSEDAALSLTLIPKKIPPRELTLRLAGHGSAVNMAGSNLAASKKAEKWEKSQPYISSIESLFRALALGELPAGYKFNDKPIGELPACRQQGIRVDFSKGQTVVGASFVVQIGVATNVSSEPLEFMEDTCGNWDIAAVAAFPRVALQPGEKTEVYVAMKRNFRKEMTIKRPSLVGGM